MKSLIRLLAFILLTTVGLTFFTHYDATQLGPGKTRYDSRSRLAGVPVSSVGYRAYGVIAMGQVAKGVLVIAQAGTGVVTFAQAGIGVLFCIGQAALGLVAFCQVGLGLFFFLGQLGGGLLCLGQGVVGYAGAGQAAAVRRGSDWLRELSAEAQQLLSFRGRPVPGRASRG